MKPYYPRTESDWDAWLLTRKPPPPPPRKPKRAVQPQLPRTESDWDAWLSRNRNAEQKVVLDSRQQWGNHSRVQPPRIEGDWDAWLAGTPVSQAVAEAQEYALTIRRRLALRLSTIPCPRNGEPWTAAEDSIVSRDDLRIIEMCYMTGRSYGAVAGRRSTLRKAATP
jgi:hypothetical protein